MNEHVPNSSGLPLRAMVMVLLFLGVVFLLVGFQTMGSSGDDDSELTSTTTTATTTAPEKPQAAPPKAAVRVYNASDEAGIAGHMAEELRGAGWNVTDVDNLALPDVAETTVYFGEAAGEHDAAEAVGELLHAPVRPRTADLAEQPPGVIVVVTG